MQPRSEPREKWVLKRRWSTFRRTSLLRFVLIRFESANDSWKRRIGGATPVRPVGSILVCISHYFERNIECDVSHHESRLWDYWVAEFDYVRPVREWRKPCGQATCCAPPSLPTSLIEKTDGLTPRCRPDPAPTDSILDNWHSMLNAWALIPKILRFYFLPCDLIFVAWYTMLYLRFLIPKIVRYCLYLKDRYSTLE